MALIAMIDDKIENESSTILMQVFEHTETLRENASKSNHGTTSFRILVHCTKDFQVINIPIMEHANEPSNVNDLVKALEHCLLLDVDIISMSLGTIYLSDAKKLNGIIKKLAEKKVIMVAATNNFEKYTLPAAYPQVIGVEYDDVNCKKEGNIKYSKDDFLGVQALANCDFAFLKNYGNYRPSNSFAVPVVVAFLNDIINNRGEKISISSALKEIERTFGSARSTRLGGWNYSSCMFKEEDRIPHIAFELEDESDSIYIEDILYKMEQEFQIEICGYSRSLKVSDVHFVEQKNIIPEYAEEMEYLFSYYMETELLFSVWRSVELLKYRHMVKPDIIIQMQESEIKVYYADASEMCIYKFAKQKDVRDVAECLYGILT